jgi:O-6-methylguanine DNA methyltransferase
MATSYTLLSLKAFNTTLSHKPLWYSLFITSAGILTIYGMEESIYRASFSELTPEEKQRHSFRDFPAIPHLLLIGTPFEHQVWQATLRIPAGSTASYGQVAAAIGHPTAVRAVARALAKNHIAYFIPCHRVLLKSGDPCGYRWGVDKKIALLRSEKEVSW